MYSSVPRPLSTRSPRVICGTPRPGIVNPPSDVPVALKELHPLSIARRIGDDEAPVRAESNAVGRMMRPLSDPIWTIRFGVSGRVRIV